MIGVDHVSAVLQRFGEVLAPAPVAKTETLRPVVDFSERRSNTACNGCNRSVRRASAAADTPSPLDRRSSCHITEEQMCVATLMAQ